MAQAQRCQHETGERGHERSFSAPLRKGSKTARKLFNPQTSTTRPNQALFFYDQVTAASQPATTIFGGVEDTGVWGGAQWLGGGLPKTWVPAWQAHTRPVCALSLSRHVIVLEKKVEAGNDGLKLFSRKRPRSKKNARKKKQNAHPHTRSPPPLPPRPRRRGRRHHQQPHYQAHGDGADGCRGRPCRCRVPVAAAAAAHDDARAARGGRIQQHGDGAYGLHEAQATVEAAVEGGGGRRARCARQGDGGNDTGGCESSQLAA